VRKFIRHKQHQTWNFKLCKWHLLHSN